MNILNNYKENSNNIKHMASLIDEISKENINLKAENNQLKEKIRLQNKIIKDIRSCMFMASLLIIILSLALKFK